MARRLGPEPRFVVDTSICVKWFVDEPDSELALAILSDDGPFLVPDLMFAEFANVMWLKQRIGAMTIKQALRAIHGLSRYFGIFDVAPSYTLAPRATWIARTLDHSVYDCFYLALAERTKTTMVTADRRFRDAVRRLRPRAPIILLSERQT